MQFNWVWGICLFGTLFCDIIKTNKYHVSYKLTKSLVESFLACYYLLYTIFIPKTVKKNRYRKFHRVSSDSMPMPKTPILPSTGFY